MHNWTLRKYPPNLSLTLNLGNRRALGRIGMVDEGGTTL